MFGLFNFDPTGMSDEELMQKSIDLHGRLAWAGRFGGADIISRLQELLRQIEFERQERVVRFIQSEQDAMFPKIIETDPELAGKEKMDELPKGKVSPSARPKPLITKTSKPVEEPNPFISQPDQEK